MSKLTLGITPALVNLHCVINLRRGIFDISFGREQNMLGKEQNSKYITLRVDVSEKHRNNCWQAAAKF